MKWHFNFFRFAVVCAVFVALAGFMACSDDDSESGSELVLSARSRRGDCTVRIRPQKTAPVRRQALFGVEHYYFFGTRRSVPPIYGCKALGTSTLPSACKLFSRKAMSILGGATTVLFRVWAR